MTASIILITSLFFTLLTPFPPLAIANTGVDNASSSDAVATTIETGDANAGAELETTANLVTIDTNATTSSPTTTPETNTGTTTPTQAGAASSSTSPTLAATSTASDTDTIISTSSATNVASTSNFVDTAAETGDNAASSSAITTINTGDAIAYVDVTNIVNTTITDSTGLIAFVNDVLDVENFDISNDLTSIFNNPTTAVSTPSCLPTTCGNLATSSVNNNAVIMNDITVTANTGDNIAAGAIADIKTGDSYASANVVNVANTNITDSSYLLLVFNNFSNYSGDIVLPASAFFDQFFVPNGSNSSASTTNQATVDNTVALTANSGGNTATGSTTTIETGDATALGTIDNTVNQNFINTGSFSMLIRVYGDWSGDIFGLPAGMSWEETPAGIRIYQTGSSNGGVSSGIQTTQNTATINNNVRVYALTGENETAGNQASISTGQAYAGASIMNLINTNIVGSNWASLIFSIYGNWSGNLSFGRSDLWLGVRAESADTPIMPGSLVTYTYTVMNRGDLTASDVNLDASFEADGLSFGEDDMTVINNSDLRHHQWSLGNIPAGATREFSYTATVNQSLPSSAKTVLPLSTTVTSQERDANPNDNTDDVAITVGRQDSSGGSSSIRSAQVSVTKSADRKFAAPGDTVTYTVTVDHKAGPLFDAYITDILTDSEGKVVNEQFIPLGDIKDDEIIKVSYSLVLGANMATGTYTNTAQVIGFHKNRSVKHRSPFSSPLATHTLNVGLGQVLGVSVCAPYLTTYLRRGATNNESEVSRLQSFLNRELGLSLTVSGTFDQATDAAVRSFQSKYTDDVLSPWGIGSPTGYVYYTTQKKINERFCGDNTVFPLTTIQKQEMQLLAVRPRR